MRFCWLSGSIARKKLKLVVASLSAREFTSFFALAATGVL